MIGELYTQGMNRHTAKMLSDEDLAEWYEERVSIRIADAKMTEERACFETYRDLCVMRREVPVDTNRALTWKPLVDSGENRDK